MFVVAATGAPEFAVVAGETDDPVAGVVLVVAAVTPVVVPVDAPVAVEGLSLDVTGAGVVVVVVEAFDTLLLKLVVL